MNNFTKFFTSKKFLFFLFAFILQTQVSNALLITCPGRPTATLNWSSSNVTASGCTLVPTSSSQSCDYNPNPDTTGSKTISSGTSCNVTLTCGSVSDSDTLEYHPELTWNGSSCVTPTSVNATITQSTSSTAPGVQFTMSWGSTGATSCGITYTGPDGGGTLVANPGATSGGPMALSPSVAGTYVITNTCTNGSTSDSASVTHTVSTTSSTDCAQTPKTWLTNCSATLPLTTSGTARTVSYNGSSYTGSATYTCNNTVWSAPTNATCNQTATPQPDLTAGGITPTSGNTGSAMTLSATITNQGDASTGTGFTNLFQSATSLDSNGNGVGVADLGTYSRSTSLSAGSSFTATRSYTPSSAGTIYIRACADKSSSSDVNGTISESTENNNCGTWTAVTISSAAPPTITLTASPTSIIKGSSSTLTRTVSGATSCNINQGVGTVSAANGSNTVSPTTNTTYTLSCTGTGGTSTATATVTVTISASPDLTAGSVSPTTATTGSATTFSIPISNTGSGTTGSSFSNLIQLATAINGGGTVTDIGSSTMTTLASGATATTSKSYTFVSAGTYSMRACADKNSAGSSGTITESNENNNCGTWTTITVASAPASCSALSTQTWLTNCSATVPAASSSATSVVNNTASGYTGSATWTCTNGTWSGPTSTSCTSTSAACSLPWGGTIPHGSSTSAYLASTVTSPSTCTSGGNSETRTCNNGTLSGSYTNQYCAVYTPPAATVSTFNLSPRTVEKGGLVKISWSIQNPSASCKISAAVQIPTSCDATCQADRAAASSTINTTLTSGTTNANDPNGASRNMTTAVTTAVSGAYAKGEKSINLDYSTTFTLTCGTTANTVKGLIYVTEKTEG